MATHHFPDKDPNRSLESWINDPRLKSSAKNAAILLNGVPDLKTWEVQYKPPGLPDTAWYVGFISRRLPYIINIKIIPSDLNIEFRYSQYLTRDISEVLKWQNTSWRYARLKDFGLEKMREIIKIYVERIRPDFENEKLKQGGKSFAEKMLEQALEVAYPGKDIHMNLKPDNLRSSCNRPLELDIHLPQLKLAIEVQGPQHFQKLYGPNDRLKENDLRKRNLCAERGIKLVWMNWYMVSKELLRMPFDGRVKYLKRFLNEFRAGKYLFCWWKDMEHQEYF